MVTNKNHMMDNIEINEDILHHKFIIVLTSSILEGYNGNIFLEELGSYRSYNAGTSLFCVVGQNL